MTTRCHGGVFLKHSSTETRFPWTFLLKWVCYYHYQSLFLINIKELGRNVKTVVLAGKKIKSLEEEKIKKKTRGISWKDNLLLKKNTILKVLFPKQWWSFHSQ